MKAALFVDRRVSEGAEAVQFMQATISADQQFNHGAEAALEKYRQKKEFPLAI